MKRPAAGLALALAAACGGGGGGGSGAPDQGTVDACYLTIGVAVPGRDSQLGSPNGWRTAGLKASESARNVRVRLAGVAVVAALNAAAVEGGLTDDEIQRYTDAVLGLEQACKNSNAFKGTPSSKKSPFATLS